MARRATTGGGRTTEIDVAEDLFKETPPSAKEEAKEGIARDAIPLVEPAAVPEKKKERPPLVEVEEEEKPKAPAAKAAPEKEPAAPVSKGAKQAGPSALLYFGVPAAGAALILGMGWMFAFIIRQGLVPARPEAPRPAEQARVLPPREPAKAPAPAPDARETLKTLAPTEPGVPSILPGGKGDETDGGKIPLEEPFFIPLEGGRQNGRGKSPTVFLHLVLTLGVSNQAAMREVAGRRSAIREAVFNHFNRLSPQDLANPRAREQAKAGLLARLSKEVAQGKVQAVYYEEFFTR